MVQCVLFSLLLLPISHSSLFPTVYLTLRHSPPSIQVSSENQGVVFRPWGFLNTMCSLSGLMTKEHMKMCTQDTGTTRYKTHTQTHRQTNTNMQTHTQTHTDTHQYLYPSLPTHYDAHSSYPSITDRPYTYHHSNRSFLLKKCT